MTALAPEHATMPVVGRLPAYASREEQVAHIAEAARQIRIQDVTWSTTPRPVISVATSPRSTSWPPCTVRC